MKILFVLDKRVDAGSIHAVANYVRAADEAGHIIALYGRPDPRYPTIRFSTDPGSFDHVLFIAETGIQLSGLQLSRLVASTPHDRRAIVDTDGMFGPLTLVDEYDYNHRSEAERQLWIARHKAMAPMVLQPSLGSACDGSLPVPFFGYDPRLRARPGSVAKRYQLVYVGHNWWRWREMSTLVLPAVREIRNRLDEICLIGSWWDAPPSWAGYLGLERAFEVDADWLRRLTIGVRPAVPYTDVVRTMSEGQINIMLQRPMLRRLRILTAKYFEIFCADTVPLVVLSREHAEAVYGPSGRELVLTETVDEAAAKLVDIVDHLHRYREIVEAVRGHLEDHHSYRCRLDELVRTLADGGRIGQHPGSTDGSARRAGSASCLPLV
jgi:hypothetical protein